MKRGRIMYKTMSVVMYYSISFVLAFYLVCSFDRVRFPLLTSDFGRPHGRCLEKVQLGFIVNDHGDYGFTMVSRVGLV